MKNILEMKSKHTFDLSRVLFKRIMRYVLNMSLEDLGMLPNCEMLVVLVNSLSISWKMGIGIASST